MTPRKLSPHHATLLLCLASYTFASAPETFVQALFRLHVKVTIPSLLHALHDPRHEVRGLAAAQLATMHVTRALPDLLVAARSEADPQEQANIAAAATWMGSPEGMHMLIEICQNETISRFTRQYAADTVLDHGGHGCLRVIPPASLSH